MRRRTNADDGTTIRVSDALRHEAPQGSPTERLRRIELWLLVDAHRWLVIGLLSAVVFLTVVIVVVLSPPSVMAYLVQGTALAKGYVELQTVDVTVVTIVLAINQLVLSPELGSLGRQRERLETVVENRVRTEELAGVSTPPTAPSEYLELLAETTKRRAERLREAVAEGDEPSLETAVNRYVEDVTRETERVAEAIADERFGTIEMLGAAMHFTTAEDIRAVRDLHAKHEASLTDAEAAAFDELLGALKLYTVAREYFRALYVQWEFINFSRAILYLGLPAVVVAHLSIGFIDANAFPGTLLGLPTLFWYETAAFTVVLVPVIVVISYAARLSMLAKASIFVSPFSPEREGGHWEE